MMETIDFLAIGELLADLMASVGLLEQAHDFQLYQGGSPANVAANMAFLGRRAALVSCVGNDGIGRRLVRTVGDLGVDISGMQVNEDEPTSIVLVGRSSGTPDFIAYRGADRQLQAINETLIERARIVHTTAFALSRPPARESILSALAAASAKGKIISVDWNFAPGIWKGDDGKAVFTQLLSFDPVLKLSLDDFARFFGGQPSIEQCKELMSGYVCRLCCLTAGADGVWWRAGNESWQHTPAVAVQEVVDTTGAGDAFWAGLMAAFTVGRPLHTCVDEGLALAARKISRRGPLYLK